MAWIKGIRNADDEIEVSTPIKFTGAGPTNTVKVTLTNTEVINLRATNKELVAAPGAGYFLEFVSGRLMLDYGGTNVFTESADNFAVNYGGASGVAASQTVEATGFIDQEADTWTNILPKIDTITTTAQLENLALTLDNNGDGEIGGNAGLDNTLVAYITYRVHRI